MGPFDFLTGGTGESEPLDPYRRPSIFEPTRQNAPGVFSPFGAVGAAMGIPTTEERLGVLEGQALNTLGKLVSEGASPEQALTRFMQMPEGQKFFGAPGVNFQGTLEKFKSLVTPPAPTTMTAGPGQTTSAIDRSGKTVNTISAPPSPTTTGPGQVTQTYNPDGSVRERTAQPTTDVQNFKSFAGLSELTADEMATLASLHATPENIRAQRMQERYINQLIGEGRIDPDFARKKAAGLIDIKPLKNPVGEETGNFVVIDMSTNPPTTISITPKVGPVRGGITDMNTTHGSFTVDRPVDSVTTQPTSISKEARLPNGRVDWDKVDPKSSMFLGVGPSSVVSDVVGRVGEAIDPALMPKEGSFGELTQKRRVALKNLENALISLSDRSGDLGTPKEVIASVKGLIEGLGVVDSPKASIEGAIRLHDRLSREIAIEKNSYAYDFDAPKADKLKQAQRIGAYERILRELPPVGDMKELLKDYRSGATNSPGIVRTIGRAVGSSVEMAANLLGKGRSEMKGDQAATLPDNAPPAARSIVEAAPKMTEAQVLEAGKTVATFPPDIQKLVGPVLAARAKELLVPTPRARPTEAGPRAQAPAAPQVGSEGTGIPFQAEGRTTVQPFPGVNIPLIDRQNPRTPFEPHTPNAEPAKKRPSPFYRKKAKEE